MPSCLGRALSLALPLGVVVRLRVILSLVVLLAMRLTPRCALTVGLLVGDRQGGTDLLGVRLTLRVRVRLAPVLRLAKVLAHLVIAQDAVAALPLDLHDSFREQVEVAAENAIGQELLVLKECVLEANNRATVR